MIPAAFAPFAQYAVLIVLLVSAALQVLHQFVRAVQSNPDTYVLITVYESGLLAHIVLMAAFVFTSISLQNDLLSGGANLPAPFNVLLWGNIAVACIAAYVALSGMGDTGEPESADWLSTVEIVIVLFCTPAALSLLGDSQFLALVVDAVYFLVRSCALLALDARNRRKVVSPLSIAEALRKLPEGLLYADGAGNIILINDAMRRCLTKLGISRRQTRPYNLWDLLNQKAGEEHGVRVPPEVASRPGAWIILRIEHDEVRLFSFEGRGFDEENRYQSALPLKTEPPNSGIAREVLGAAPRYRIIAYDVTEELRILEEIEETNAELETSLAELRASMATVREAAENEAMLRMRGRVHDVIGQRLSMLHRSLEDNAISDEQLERLKPLLNGILDDLAADNQTSPADELAATVNAFGLTGVVIAVEGELPSDEQRAELFADCIREGATNAVKHAIARNVRVTMSERELVIANDGQPASEPIQEGTGLANMRRAVEGEGGSLEITPEPFTLRISFNGSLATGALTQS